MKATTATVRLDDIVSAGNIRHDLGDIDELANSILSVGLLEPPVVSDQMSIDGKYTLLAGHRRVAALRKLKWSDVDVVIRHIPGADGDIARLIVQLVENLQRRDLEPIEEARGYAQLRAMGVKQADIARRVGRSAGHVSKRLALVDLPEEIAKHADNISAENLYEIARASKAGADLTEIASVLDSGRPVDIRDTALAMKRLEATKQLDARVAELKSQGVNVLTATYSGMHPTLPKDRIGYGGFLGFLDIDAHAKEPCHAVCVYIQWGTDVMESAHCTDRRRHEAEGASDLKARIEPSRSKTDALSAADIEYKRKRAIISTTLTKAVEAAASRLPAKETVLWHIAESWVEFVTNGFEDLIGWDLVADLLNLPDESHAWSKTQAAFIEANDAKARTRILWALLLAMLRTQVDDFEAADAVLDDSLSRANYDRLVDILSAHGFAPVYDFGGEEE